MLAAAGRRLLAGRYFVPRKGSLKHVETLPLLERNLEAIARAQHSLVSEDDVYLAFFPQLVHRDEGVLERR